MAAAVTKPVDSLQMQPAQSTCSSLITHTIESALTELGDPRAAQ